MKKVWRSIILSVSMRVKKLRFRLSGRSTQKEEKERDVSLTGTKRCGAYCSTGLESLPFQRGTGPWRSVTDLPMRERSDQPAGKRVALATLEKVVSVFKQSLALCGLTEGFLTDDVHQ